MSKLENKIPLEEVLVRFKKHNEEFKGEIEKREELENKIDSVESIQNEIKSIKYSTELKKNKFIQEIKQGLGNEIKKNPNTIQKIEKKWHQNLFMKIRRFFTKF